VTSTLAGYTGSLRKIYRCLKAGKNQSCRRSVPVSRMLRLQILLIGSLVLALVAWGGVVATAGSRNLKPSSIESMRAVGVATSRTPAPAPQPTAQATPRAQGEASPEARADATAREWDLGDLFAAGRHSHFQLRGERHIT
jgi:hypothetical protein